MIRSAMQYVYNEARRWNKNEIEIENKRCTGSQGLNVAHINKTLRAKVKRGFLRVIT